jgi:hypothetical protein
MRKALAAVTIGVVVVSCRATGGGPGTAAVRWGESRTATAGLEWKGSHGGPRVPTQLVARNDAEWQGLATLFGLRPPVPPIDFARQMVVAVGLGERSTGGYAVTILAAEERAGVLYVRYQEHQPRAGDLVIQVITTPYHVRALPRSDAPQVVFERVEGAR